MTPEPQAAYTPSASPATPEAPIKPATPSILAVVEMNLEEYPAFRLGRRSKRPELGYVRSRTESDGRTLQQRWIVRGAEGLGLPGPFEQDLYVALLVLFTEQGLPSDGRIRFTRNRLAQVMGCSNSGRGYELLEQGLQRLAGATVVTEHAFYRPSPIGAGGERSGPAERLSLTFHILEEVRVYERSARVPAETNPAAEAQARVELARPMELSVARLGLPLVQSYERRYTKGLDASFYFTLSRPLAKRLYRYLDKVRNGRGSFEIGLRGLGDVLGLEYRYPSDIKDGLTEAHAELRDTGYLALAGYAPLAGGPGAGEKVVYTLDTAFDRRPRRRAGAASSPSAREVREAAKDSSPAPLQLELESFGITPARAAALLATHSEAHVAARIEYVRDLLRRNGTGSAGQGQAGAVKNPAGLLARAIERAYVVPAMSSTPTPAPLAPPVPLHAARLAPANASAPPPTTTASRTVDSPSAPAQEDPTGGRWTALAAALRERLTAASYAAWVLSAHPALPAEGAPADELTLLVPSAFALDRWRRPPLSSALSAAAGALNLSVTIAQG